MLTRRWLSLAPLLVACILSACGSAGGSSPPPNPVVSATPTPTLTPPPVAADVPDRGATPPPGAKDAPAPPHDALDLEALIPDAIAGVSLTKSSSRAGPENAELASRLGIQVADIAFAHATTTSDDFVAVIEATRVTGADAAQLRDITLETIANSLASGPSVEVIGGKQVVAVSNSLGYRFYLYASGDVLYTVSVRDALVATDVLAALPSP
jgi:hypothetical protein